MCNVNNFSLTIDAIRNCMFLKVVENTWSVISYCTCIFGLLDFKYCEKPNWSRMNFFYYWDFDRARRQLWIWNKLTC
jgi:hypothetical protein